MFKIFWLLSAAAMLIGCGKINLGERDGLQQGVVTAGTTTLFKSRKDIDQIDLVRLLDPDLISRDKFNNPRKNRYQKSSDNNVNLASQDAGSSDDGSAQTTPSPANEQSKNYEGQDAGVKIDLAFSAFYDDEYRISQKLRRNRLQERLLVASNERCNLYLNYLQELRTGTNFFLGSLATTAGVIGSIVTGATASRALSGASGIFSGTRAEFNQELFSNLAIQVLSHGIKLRRREIYNQIVLRGQVLDIEKYTVESAVKDAITYHGHCSVVTGFEVANNSIQTLDDPGIDTANRVLAKLNITRKLLQNRTLTPEEGALTLMKTSSILAGTPLTTSGLADTDLPLGTLSQSTKKMSQALSSVAKSVASLRNKVSDDVLKPLSPGLDLIESKGTAALNTCRAKAVTAEREVSAASRVVTTAGEKDRLRLRAEQSKKHYAALQVSAQISAIYAIIKQYIDAIETELSKSPPQTANDPEKTKFFTDRVDEAKKKTSEDAINNAFANAKCT